MYKRFFILIILVLFVSCEGKGGGGGGAWYKTVWGYPDVSGSYTAQTGTDCSFTSVGNTFSVSQGEADETDAAKLDISTGGLTVDASITKGGSITATISDGGEKYNCTGSYSEEKKEDYVNKTADLTCQSGSSSCKLIGTTKDYTEGGVSSTIGETSSTISEPGQINDENQVKLFLKENAVGTWCYKKDESSKSIPSAAAAMKSTPSSSVDIEDQDPAASEPPPFIAIYVDENVNISVGDPTKVQDQLNGGVITYVNAEIKSESFESKNEISIYIKYIEASPTGYTNIFFSADDWAKVDDATFIKKAGTKLDKCY